MGRSMTRDERLRIRCREDVKNTFQSFAAGYDTQEAALVALLDAYAEDRNRVAAVTFDTDRLGRER